MIWWILLSITLTGVAWLGTLFRIRVRKRLDLVDWFVGTMGAINGVGYAFVIWATHSGRNPYWASWILPYNEYYWLFPILSLIAVMGVWLSATVAGSLRTNLLTIKHADLSPKSLSRIEKLAWVLLLLGILSYWQYARAYGGFIALLNYSNLIRSGLFDVIGIDNPWSFLQRLGGLVFFSSFLFYALVIERQLKNRTQILNALGLVISLCFSLYVLYSWLGRVAIIAYLAVFPLSYIYYRHFRGHFRIHRMSVRLFFLILTIAIALPLLSLWMTPGKSSRDIFEFYARELSFPTVSFLSAIESDEFRFCRDLLVAPLYVLPQRIWSGVIGYDTASDINTVRIYGYRKGEGGVTGGIPTDMVTFSYMQLGVVGVALMGILLGAALVWLEKLILQAPTTGLRAVFYAYCALMLSALTVLYADPQHIIRRNIHFIVGIFTLFVFAPRRHVRRGAARRYRKYMESEAADRQSNS